MAKHFALIDVCDFSCLLYELCLLFCNFVRPQFNAQPVYRYCFIHDFTDKVIFTDEVSTVRFVTARLSPLKEYRDPIVRTPCDVTLRQKF